MTTDRLGIYIHIPFCLSKCYYCDFCSRTGASSERKDAYVAALKKEIRAFADGSAKKKSVDTIYFGGGTPTLLSEANFADILDCIGECFDVLPDAEITAEANPKTADTDKLSAMRRLGINRLSIGMQSVHDNELKALGRLHKFSDFEAIFSNARAVGFDNISVDLMYGIPEQTMLSFEESVRRLISLSPEHISSYCLKIEEGTRFFDKKDTLPLPSEDTVCDMYESMCNILRDAGYNKYEISNFAVQGRESRHNLKYWRYDDYIGFGAGAHSFVCGVRFANSDDVDAYIVGDGLSTREQESKIEPDEARNEYVMLRMRLSEGVIFEDYRSRFDREFLDDFADAIKRFSSEYFSVSNGRCAFTERGMLVSNYILSEMLDFS